MVEVAVKVVLRPCPCGPFQVKFGPFVVHELTAYEYYMTSRLCNVRVTVKAGNSARFLYDL